MFKKPIKIGAQNQLSGKDRKTMRNKLVQLFDEACVDKIMNVNDKIISCKTSGSKMVIYNGNDYPLFVDGTGKNDYFPSLYTAIAYQPLIKVILLNEGVQSYIYNGANLMWPGVRDYSGLGNFEKDQVVGIRTAKGQLVAIGAMGSSLKEFQCNADKSGVAVYILHYFNDQLWAQGPKTKPQIIVVAEKPKPKQQVKVQQPIKQQKKVEEKPKTQKITKKGKKQQEEQETRQQNKKVQQKTENKQKSQKNKKQSSQQKPEKKQQSEQSDGQADFSSLVHNKKPKPTHTQPIKVQKKGNQKNFSDDEDNDKKQKVKKKPVKKQQNKEQPKKKGKKQSDNQQKSQNSQVEGEEKKQAAESKQEQKSAVSSKLMDQQFKQAFLNALKLSKVQGELPIDSGRFYMDFMLLARPHGIKLQIKDTSYKKLGKFYEEMAKQKFIQFKHNKDKKGQPGASIAKILWDNDELKNYEPTILRMSEKDVQQKQDHSESKKKLKLNQSLQVQNVYKLHPNFKNAFYAKKVNYAPTQQQEKEMKKQEQQMKNLPQFYSETQVRALIQKYINDKLTPKRDKDKKDDKQKKTDKMVPIDYKNNEYLAQLLKKQIQEFLQNAEGNKQQVDSDQEQQNKKNKKKKQHVMRMDRGALVNRILRTCSTSYHMKDKQNNIESFHEGTFKGIQLVAEKSNNKNITKIIGLETFIVPKSEIDEQINGFANSLKEKFACSVNIQNLPGKNAGKEIIVHGNFINQLQELFTQQYKLNEEYIASQNKLDKKKKR